MNKVKNYDINHNYSNLSRDIHSGNEVHPKSLG